ncbi:MAG: peroxiredoxin [Alphaproteobacteria bacterium]|nr:peroxiredoxin [Alphaproteobacteria bacterium]
MVKKKSAHASAPAKKQAVKKTVKKPVAPAKTGRKPAGPAIGAKAPAFSMPVTPGGAVSSASLKGKPYVLYFYPKDDTSGCTAEACGFRDALPAFGRLGTKVIGVSRDSIASHEKFIKKYKLTFPLASDESGKVCATFGAWVQKSMYGRAYMGIERSTFLIDGKGIVRAVWRKVSVPGHVDEVKKAVQNL